jgi:hypothetical protein
VPATPSGVRATTGTLGVSLGWNTSSDATSYNVKRSLVSGGSYTNLVIQSPVNAATDSTASPGTPYFYVVSAMNASGESGDSIEVSAATPIPVPPAPVTWFRADGIGGLSSGATVANWPDASGNGYHATQNTANRRPAYITNAINGLPVVRFNGVNSNYLVFPRPVQDDFTIFCVYRSSQGVGTGTQFYHGAGLVNGEVASVVNDFGLSLNANGKLLAGTGNPDVTIASTSSSYTNGQPHIVTFKRTRSAGSLVLYGDGGLQGTATGGKQSLTSPTQLVLGAQQTLINYLTGDIAEVKIFEAALNDSDRVAEENALLCKYGLGAGAPPATPRGLSTTAGNRQVFVNWLPTAGASGYKLNWSAGSAGPYTQLIGNLATNAFVHTNAVSGQTNYYKVAAFSACGNSADSAPVGVLLALPTMGINPGTNSLTLTWPDWADGWRLWSATNLAPPVTWSLVTNSASSSNGLFSVKLPFRFNVELFRLVSP